MITTAAITILALALTLTNTTLKIITSKQDEPSE